MPLSRMFIKASIKKMKSIYVCNITYSYYGLYHYNIITTHETLEEAKNDILIRRCNGLLNIEVNNSDQSKS